MALQALQLPFRMARGIPESSMEQVFTEAVARNIFLGSFFVPGEYDCAAQVDRALAA